MTRARAPLHHFLRIVTVAACLLCAEAAPLRAEGGPPTVVEGVASWYGVPFHGRRTASGEVFDKEQLTAAHKTLPFGTMVRVTNLGNGRSIVVRITDRGPFVKGRIIDLSEAAARAIDMIGTGTARVRLEYGPGADRSEGRGPGSAPGIAPPAGGLLVQACSLSSRARAEQVAGELARALGRATRIEEVLVAGRPAFRVLVIPEGDAAGLIAALAARGYPGAFARR